jgi:hypothetical protein
MRLDMKTPFVAVVSFIGLVALSSSALAQTKTVKACQDEWRANRTAMQAAGKTQAAYVVECRAGKTSAQPATPPAASTPAASPPAASTPAATPPAASAKATAAAPARPTATPTGAGQYATEAEAKAHCPADLVVWANLSSKIFHFSSNKTYGKTKRGAYMCEKDAVAGGIRAAKNEKRPAGA